SENIKMKEVKIINQGLEDEMEVSGYRPCLWKMILVGVGAVCSGGLLLLLLYWLPEWGVKSTCTHTSLKDAHTVLLRTTVGKQRSLSIHSSQECRSHLSFYTE
uniref:Cation-transporting ATPase n=1 Tax=Amphilophus citrinellus TaxID=61819 RepID=A0A3Q0T820_AMPCI